MNAPSKTTRSLIVGVVIGAALLSADTYADPGQGIARIGLVSPSSPYTVLRGVSAFKERLHELGWVEGKNLVIEERWAEGQYDRLPALMKEVVSHKIDVLFIWGTPAAIAAKNATSTIPIVDATMADPVRSGVVASLARPGGNLTGLSMGYGEGMAGKWLELLQDAVPRLSSVTVIENPHNPTNRDQRKDLETVAPTRGVKLWFIEAGEPDAIDRAFEQAKRKTQAVLVLPDSGLLLYRQRITALAAKHRLPALYTVRDFMDAGGLMAYALDLEVQFRRAAEYIDKILKGAKPSDMPIEQPTKFQLFVNLKVAKALGLKIPESILLRADEVIR